MARRPSDTSAGGTALLVLALAACCALYTGIALARRRAFLSIDLVAREEEGGGAWECCKGMENTELWGSVVKWGTDLRFNTSKECCEACKELCGDGGPCLCDTWVFCGDRHRCADKFGECWLKKQKDVLVLDVHQSGEQVMWTSGLIFGIGEGIVGLETEHGILHMKLLPDCAPHSVAYILELLGSHHCAGCQFYRAENRLQSWNAQGNHIDDASFGPPYGLLQGTLGAQGVPFKDIPKEHCPEISRGSVAWVDSGPEFFISLANHGEWRTPHTVFATLVLPEDMTLADRLASPPTSPDVWNGITVSLLENPIKLKIKSIMDNDKSLGRGSAS